MNLSPHHVGVTLAVKILHYNHDIHTFNIYLIKCYTQRTMSNSNW